MKAYHDKRTGKTTRNPCTNAEKVGRAGKLTEHHRTIGNHRKFEVETTKPIGETIGYVRVSTHGQKDDLEVQKKAPNYGTYMLKNRLLEAGIKQNKCESCELTEWRGAPIALELHHLNGRRKDHRLENLQMLCPNCHSQTPTFRAKNKGKGLSD